MTLKIFWESRILKKDKRIALNRIFKDVLFYGLMVLCFALLILIISGTFEGTVYAVYLASVIIVVRFILKCLEKHRPEEFRWFWERMEWLIKLVNSILNLLGKTPIPILT